MKFCTNCGAQLPDESTVCSQCNFRIPDVYFDDKTVRVSPVPVAQPGAEQASAEQPYVEQPYAEQPYAEQPYAEQPYAEQPYAEQPYAEQPYVEQPSAEQPYVQQPAAAQPYVGQPYAGAPYGAYPGAQEPVATAPAGKPPKKGKGKLAIIITVAAILVLAVVFAVLVLTHVICLFHEYEDATCTDPETCEYCGKEQGEANGHSWTAATCTTAKKCSECGELSGEPAGHDWQAATCTAAKTCNTCGETEGEPTGHTKTERVAIKEATLTEKGEEQEVCSACKKELDTYSVDVKDADVEGNAFNFKDEEFIDWINSILNVKINSTVLQQEGDYTYYAVTLNGETGAIGFIHNSDGYICAIAASFDDWTSGAALIIAIGEEIDPRFSSDTAASYLADGEIYTASGMSTMVVDEVSMLAPTDYLLSLD